MPPNLPKQETYCKPARAGTGPTTAAAAMATAGENAAPQANGAGLLPTLEVVLGSSVSMTSSARLIILKDRAAARVIAILAAAVARLGHWNVQ